MTRRSAILSAAYIMAALSLSPMLCRSALALDAERVRAVPEDHEEARYNLVSAGGFLPREIGEGLGLPVVKGEGGADEFAPEPGVVYEWQGASAEGEPKAASSPEGASPHSLLDSLAERLATAETNLAASEAKVADLSAELAKPARVAVKESKDKIEDLEKQLDARAASLADLEGQLAAKDRRIESLRAVLAKTGEQEPEEAASGGESATGTETAPASDPASDPAASTPEPASGAAS